MNKQQIIALLILLVSLALLLWYITRQNPEPSVAISDQEVALFVNATTKEYYNEDGSEVVKIEYVGDLARLNGTNYQDVILRQVVSASGAKYEGANGLSIWSKGEEVRIETPQQVQFKGIEKIVAVVPEPTPEETPVVESVPEASSTIVTSDLLGKSWILRSAVSTAEEDLLTGDLAPFTLTFTSETAVSGETDCNNFGGEYSVIAGTLTLTNLVSTLMACTDSQESTFIALLSGPLAVTLKDSTLLLVTTAGDELNFLAE